MNEVRVLEEGVARSLFPISVLFIRREGVEWLIDDDCYMTDVNTFLKEASRYGFYLGHVSAVEVREKGPSRMGEFLRMMKQKVRYPTG